MSPLTQGLNYRSACDNARAEPFDCFELEHAGHKNVTRDPMIR